MEPIKNRVVLLHGFTTQEISAVLKAVKTVVDEPERIAFSMTTPNNIDWKVKDLIKEVSEEHDFMKNRQKKNGQES